jgi:hypothetical protein
MPPVVAGWRRSRNERDSAHHVDCTGLVYYKVACGRLENDGANSLEAAAHAVCLAVGCANSEARNGRPLAAAWKDSVDGSVVGYKEWAAWGCSSSKVGRSWENTKGIASNSTSGNNDSDNCLVGLVSHEEVYAVCCKVVACIKCTGKLGRQTEACGGARGLNDRAASAAGKRSHSVAVGKVDPADYAEVHHIERRANNGNARRRYKASKGAQAVHHGRSRRARGPLNKEVGAADARARYGRDDATRDGADALVAAVSNVDDAC